MYEEKGLRFQSHFVQMAAISLQSKSQALLPHNKTYSKSDSLPHK